MRSSHFEVEGPGGEVVGRTRRQFPIHLAYAVAYAVAVHKRQGLTLDWRSDPL